MSTIERMSGGPYCTIVIDPPWEMPETGKTSGVTATGWGKYRGGTVKLPYATMPVEQIAALPIGACAALSAHLYVWTTNRFLESTYDLVRGWGFRPAQLLTWCKPPMGIGFGGAFTTTTEFVLFARRGKLAHAVRQDSSWWQWNRVYENGYIAHSAKPDAFLDIVEQVSPGPYLEMFARRARFGWDYWGDESLGTAEMPTPDGGVAVGG